MDYLASCKSRGGKSCVRWLNLEKECVASFYSASPWARLKIERSINSIPFDDFIWNSHGNSQVTLYVGAKDSFKIRVQENANNRLYY